MGNKGKSVRTRIAYFVVFPWMDYFLLNNFNLQSIQLLIQNLTEIYNNTLMDLLPQVSSKYLKGYLQRLSLL
ncbi:hypothetical protein JHK82_016763 [Glycine max]|uniref:Uncharacterized protein n=1 Tax=Glycine soja TaxID=3848 RepID=A0A445KFI4_GLYSO|nr:hypothetical protein JHK87_016697 [Glycine soja]KAG5033196.1 hypothetical protein JHK85_017178 [Glycine max]KAG5047396.1 hypothetical protein JHK86_016802 [Glycine max]KAG5149882.1 hypothetical protein JHK82_016763 [Glycine max]KAH1128023.1 hypothetical protein GYH30_016543 [Glycine max]